MVEVRRVQDPFPVVMGNEEETGMLIGYGGAVDEPYDLVGNLPGYLPDDLYAYDDEFLKNGFRVYPGDTGEPDSQERQTNLERATPECTTPQQLTAHVRASELLLRKIVLNYAEIYSGDNPEDVAIRVQRRVVDSQGSRKGCHDNYGLDLKSKNARSIISHSGRQSTLLNPVMRTYMGSRIFIVGAGYVNESNGLYYSQKVGGLADEVSYGYAGSMARLEAEIGSVRFETRCNDINISDWATNARIGGVALCLALLETGQSADLEKHADQVGGARFRERLKWLNQLYLDQDGTLIMDSAQRALLAFQQHAAELALTKLGHVTDIPAPYYRLANEIYDFCDDLVKVAEGESDITTLADRADWAAKLSIIRSRVLKDRSFGIERQFDDIGSAAVDMRYDYFEIQAQEGKVTQLIEGIGYKLRSKGAFRDTVTDNDALRAYVSPPANTRAKLRSKIIKSYYVESCDWGQITYRDAVTGELSHLYINPLETELSDDNEESLVDLLRPQIVSSPHKIK